MRIIAVILATLILMFSVAIACAIEIDTQRGHEVIRLDVSNALEVEWSADLTKLAILTGEEIFVWDTKNWELLYTIPDAYSYDIAWHPTDNLLAGTNCCGVERILIWNGETGELESQLIRQLSEDMYMAILRAIDWSPDGKYIASDSTIDTVVLWDTESEDFNPLVSLNDPYVHSITELSWSASSTHILSTGVDGTIRVWDVLSGENIFTVEGYKHIDWHPDETFFAGASFGNKLKIWNMKNAHVEIEFLGHTNTITSVDWNPNGQVLSSTDADGNLFIWEFTTGNELMVNPHEAIFITDANWRPDGDQLAISTRTFVSILNWK